jgi:hypothetical protein
MSSILSMLLPATVASAAAALALALSSGAPPRWRLAVATAGMLAWVIPWPFLVLPLMPSDASIAAKWVGDMAQGFTNLGLDSSAGMAKRLLADQQVSSFAWRPAVALAMVLLPGMWMFVTDIFRYRRNLARLNRESVGGEQLRNLLPTALRTVPHAIRIVPCSQIAAATGLLRGTIWIGQGLNGHSYLNAALLHECLHIARKDTLALLAVTLVKRLYFWNPMVRYFAGRIELFIEAACDEDCARFLGRIEYRNSLARLILDSESARTMVFGSAIKTGNQDVERVAALSTVPRVHVPACIAVTLCVLGFCAAAALNAREDAADPRIGSWEEQKTSTDYQSLRRVFENLGNGTTRMVVNAKLLEANRWHVDFKCDGAKYRTLTNDGKFTGITYACRRTGRLTFETSFTHGRADEGVELHWTPQDWTIGTAVETVSADGTRYTTVLVRSLTNGQTREERREFVRRS